jgi:hypothetical protein
MCFRMYQKAVASKEPKVGLRQKATGTDKISKQGFCASLRSSKLTRPLYEESKGGSAPRSDPQISMVSTYSKSSGTTRSLGYKRVRTPSPCYNPIRIESVFSIAAHTNMHCELKKTTHLTAPPVYSTANSSRTKSVNPNPRGAKGVNRDSMAGQTSVSVDSDEDGSWADTVGLLSAASIRTVRTKAEVMNISIKRPYEAATRTVTSRSARVGTHMSELVSVYKPELY